MKIVDADAVLAQLRTYGVPVDEWGACGEGRKPTKTLDHLLKEIECGETTLAVQDGVLVRQIRTLSIDVHCLVNGQWYELLELCQVFEQQRKPRYRTDDGGGPRKGVAEKLTAGEHPKDAVCRAIAEELGITKLKHVLENGVERKQEISPSYPGLTTEYQIYRYIVEVHLEDFKFEGYCEVQKDKRTYFIWARIIPAPRCIDHGIDPRVDGMSH